MNRFMFIIRGNEITESRLLGNNEWFEKEREFDPRTQQLNWIIIRADTFEEARSKALEAIENMIRNR